MACEEWAGACPPCALFELFLLLGFVLRLPVSELQPRDRLPRRARIGDGSDKKFKTVWSLRHGFLFFFCVDVASQDWDSVAEESNKHDDDVPDGDESVASSSVSSVASSDELLKMISSVKQDTRKDVFPSKFAFDCA